FFFFSSRRRHTRFSRDWSSDVCSSDLSIFVRGAANRSIEIAVPDHSEGVSNALQSSGARRGQRLAHALVPEQDRGVGRAGGGHRRIHTVTANTSGRFIGFELFVRPVVGPQTSNSAAENDARLLALAVDLTKTALADGLRGRHARIERDPRHG